MAEASRKKIDPWLEPVRVRLGKRNYLLDSSIEGKRLIRITNNPLDPDMLLVWRMEKSGSKDWRTGVSGRNSIRVYNAKKEGNGIKEGFEVASLIYDTYWRGASVYHFEVKPSFRRKTLGKALRETLLQDLKSKGTYQIRFPPHMEEEFYTSRGFERAGGGYKGMVKQLGVKPKDIKLKVLWQKPLR